MADASAGDRASRLGAQVQELVQAEKWAEALQVLDELTTLRPGNASVWYNKGVAHFRLGHREAAQAALGRCLEFQPGHPRATQLLRRIRAAAGASDTAPAPVPDAAMDAPADLDNVWEADRLLQEAYLERSRGNATRAIELAQQASALNPDDASIPYFLGETFCQQRRYAEAVESLEAALSLKPDLAKAADLLEQARRSLPSGPPRADQHPGGEPGHEESAEGTAAAPIGIVILAEEWLAEGWHLLWGNVVQWLAVDLVGAGLTFGPPILVMVIAGRAVPAAAEASAAGSPLPSLDNLQTLLGAGLLLTLAALAWILVVGTSMGLGRLLIAARLLRTGHCDVGLLMRGFRLLGAIWLHLLILLLVWAAVGLSLGLTVVWLPVATFYVYPVLSFSGLLVCLGGRRGLEAMVESYERTRKDWLPLALFLLLLQILGPLLSILAILVGAAVGTAVKNDDVGVLVILALSWPVAHWLLLVFLVGYRDNFGDDGMRGAVERFPGLLN